MTASIRFGFSGSEMSNTIPLPEHAPAAIFLAGNTVMSWHWSVRLVSCVPSPWSPPRHSPAIWPSAANTRGLSTIRAFAGSASGISITSMLNSAVRVSPVLSPMQPASSSSSRTPEVPEL